MIYIASKTIHAPRWRELRACGVPVISTWIDEANKNQTRNMADLWQRCVREAMTCETLIAFRTAEEVLKGALIEIGAALANDKQVILVGFDAVNFSFKHHPNCKTAPDMKTAIALALPYDFQAQQCA